MENEHLERIRVRSINRLQFRETLRNDLRKGGEALLLAIILGVIIGVFFLITMHRSHADGFKPTGFSPGSFKSGGGGGTGGGGYHPPQINTPVLIHPESRNGPSREIIHYKRKGGSQCAPGISCP